MQSFTGLGQYSSQYCPDSHTSSYALALAIMATVEPSCADLCSEKQLARRCGRDNPPNFGTSNVKYVRCNKRVYVSTRALLSILPLRQLASPGVSKLRFVQPGARSRLLSNVNGTFAPELNDLKTHNLFPAV